MNAKQTRQNRESKPYSKSTREFQEFPQSSRFTQIKAKFDQELAKIIQLRTVQSLARVYPKSVREQTLDTFKKLYRSLVAHLDMLREELLNRKNLQELYTATKAGRAFSDQGVKSTLGNNAPSEDEQSFINSKLLQEVKTIQANYREIFIEGSLKRLNIVCQCTDLPYDFNLDFDIGQWSQSLSDFIKKKQKNSFWCCFD